MRYIALLFFLIPFKASAQQYTGFVAGTNFTFEWQEDAYFGDIVYQEYTWSLNAAMNWNDHWTTGLNHTVIFGRSREAAKTEIYQRGGIFGQYAPWVHEKVRPFAELGFYRGNYCRCEEEFPYKEKGLYYFSAGLGADVPLSSRFHLDLGYQTYFQLQPKPYKDFHWLYILGINYYFLK